MSNHNKTNIFSPDKSEGIHISCLALSNRSKNALFRNGVFSTNDLLHMSQKTILNKRGIGTIILKEIENALALIGCTLPAEPNPAHLDFSEKVDFNSPVPEKEEPPMPEPDPWEYQWN